MIQTPSFWLTILATCAVYWCCTPRYRAAVLATASVAYLSWLSIEHVILYMLMTLALFAAANAKLEGRSRRVWVATSVWGLILLLVFFKVGRQHFAYFEDVAIPFGLSYFTFKQIHYVLESSRGRLPPYRLPDYLCYTFLLSTMTAGPIERFDHFLNNRSDGWSTADFLEGLQRISIGLVKKFVFASTLLLKIVDVEDPQSLVDRLSYLPPWKVGGFLLVAYLYTYLDFSAYTDIAVGVARLFGIRIMENFNYPFLATNIAEFWKRWHMTLAGWCQAYVYMPLLGKTRQPYAALYGTFVAMGLWHGISWSWVAWGLYHATGVAICLTWQRRRRLSGRQPLQGPVVAVTAALATNAFFAGGIALSMSDRVGGPLVAVAVWARMLGLNFEIGL